MKYLVELPVATGGGPPEVVGVEIEHVEEGVIEVSRPGQAVARATRTLGEMLAGILPVAESFLDGFAGMDTAPSEICLEFGLSLSADANLVVASSTVQANFKVALTWHPEPAPEAPSVPAEPEGGAA